MTAGSAVAAGAALSDEVSVVREATGLTRLSHLAVIRVDGPDAFALLDLTSPGPLFLREGQMRHTLLLDEAAAPIADLFVCSDEEGFFLLAEGLGEQALCDLLEARRTDRLPAASVTIRALTGPHGDHDLLGLNGPYAWEVAAAFLGPAVLGMPYLSLLRVDDVVCFRAGKTGEFGYDLLIPRAGAPSAWDRLLEVGAAYDLAPVALATLDLCALENWHFNIRTMRPPGLAGSLTPIELQLQWRVDPRRDFVGAEALRARRASGAAVRATSVISAGELAAGQSVALAGADCGEILAAARSPTLQASVGIALLPIKLAHPGIADFVARTDEGAVSIATRTPPLIRNRSLFIDPHRHSYLTRAQEAFPPLVSP
jgi:glycine cleavage system aminomethyltransferase T